MRQRQSAFRHHLHQVSQAQFESTIPAHAQNNHRAVEVPAFEQLVDALPACLLPTLTQCSVPVYLTQAFHLHQSDYPDQSVDMTPAASSIAASPSCTTPA